MAEKLDCVLLESGEVTITYYSADTGEHSRFLSWYLVANSNFLFLGGLFVEPLLPLVYVHPWIEDVLVELRCGSAHPLLDAVRVTSFVKFGLLTRADTCLGWSFGFSFPHFILAQSGLVVELILHRVWYYDDIRTLFIVSRNAGYLDYRFIRSCLARSIAADGLIVLGHDALVESSWLCVASAVHHSSNSFERLHRKKGCSSESTHIW